MQMVCLLAARCDAVDGATVGSFDVHPQQVDALDYQSLAKVSRVSESATSPFPAVAMSAEGAHDS
jgi:hypothetical protein